MFSTFKQKVLLAGYIIIVLSIPAGSFLVSQYQNLRSRAQEPKQTVTPTPKPAPSKTPAKKLLSDSESALKELLKEASSEAEQTPSPTIATSFGPTLSFRVSLEGRPKDNQAGKVFVAVSEGSLTANPKFLLTFLVDVPKEGHFKGLSIAGLNSGSSYTALLKGSAQIATSSAFITAPAETKLNSDQVINMLTGDLNEDNVVNSADYSIAQKAYLTTSTSSNWNENVDFNKDGLINTLDLSLIIKNMGKVGASGAWTSPIPTATSSASLTEKLPAGSAYDGSTGGYWLWIPK